MIFKIVLVVVFVVLRPHYDNFQFASSTNQRRLIFLNNKYSKVLLYGFHLDDKKRAKASG